MTEPALEFLFDMTVDLGEGVQIGATPYGDISFQHATGGTVSGPRIQGKVLPIGGDRVVGRSDGSSEINVQAVIETEDGHHILMAYKGLIRPVGPSAGTDGPPEMYWRTAPFFETAAEPYRWLNDIMAIGHGDFGDGQVLYKIYAVR